MCGDVQEIHRGLGEPPGGGGGGGVKAKTEDHKARRPHNIHNNQPQSVAAKQAQERLICYRIVTKKCSHMSHMTLDNTNRTSVAFL